MCSRDNVRQKGKKNSAVNELGALQRASRHVAEKTSESLETDPKLALGVAEATAASVDSGSDSDYLE